MIYIFLCSNLLKPKQEDGQLGCHKFTILPLKSNQDCIQLVVSLTISVKAGAYPSGALSEGRGLGGGVDGEYSEAK